MAIGASAVETIDETLSGAVGEVQKTLEDNAKTFGDDALKTGAEVKDIIIPADYMRSRIEDFETGREAIQDVKLRLREVVGALIGTPQSAPIVIIIDELDRCRPTYSIKLLEEVKHLFDIDGIVFILGMNSDQLAHSVSAAYGQTFDSSSYLDRFISRRYTLREPPLEPLVSKCVSRLALDRVRLEFPGARLNQRPRSESVNSIISAYMLAFRVSPRHVYKVIDLLQTCIALTSAAGLLMPLLLPLIIFRVQGVPRMRWAAPPSLGNLKYELTRPGFGVEQTLNLWEMFTGLQQYAELPYDDYMARMYQEDRNDFTTILSSYLQPSHSQNTLSSPSRYDQLLETVGRFCDTAR